MSRKLDRLRRAYPNLTVFERVELVLAAQERADLAESQVLDDTCPGPDVRPYLTRLLALEHSAALLVVQLLAREVLLIQKLADLARDAASSPALDPDLVSILQGQAALWRGFVAWCQEMGHLPHQVLLMAPLGAAETDPSRFVVHGQLQRFETWPDDLLPDPYQEQMWRDLFRRFSTPPGP